MATVFVAEDTRYGRKVAVKVLNPDLASTLGAERFEREIQILGKLNHPHILSVLDSGDRLGEVPAGQMFTPFFTTKKGGQGIGLLFVREVLNRHGLAYRLAPTGQGETRFDVWFPDPAAGDHHA